MKAITRHISSIFKTYTSDLDGLSNKLGFSKRSFADWSTQVTQSFNDAGGGLNGFKNALSTAFTIPKEFKEIKLIKKEDFSTLFPSVKNADGFFSSFNRQGLESLSTLTKWCDEIKLTDKTMTEYLRDCMQKQVPASFEGYNYHAKIAIANNEKLSLSTRIAATATKALAIAQNMLVMILVAQGIQLVTQVISDQIHKLDKLREKASEAADNYQKLTKETDSLNDELKTTSDRLKELDKIGYKNLSLVDKDEYNRLVVSNEELERTLRIKKALAAVAAQEAGDAAKKALTVDTETSITKVGDVRGQGNMVAAKISPIDSLNEYVDLAEKQRQQLQDAEQALRNFEDTYVGSSEKMVRDRAWQKLNDNVTDVKNSIDDTESTISKKYPTIENESKALVDSFGNIVPGCEDISEQVNAVIGRLDQYFSKVKQNADSTSKAVNGVEDATQKDVGNKDVGQSIDDFQSKLKTLASAIKKVKDGKLSASDFVDLQQEFPELTKSTNDLGKALSDLVDDNLSDLTTELSKSGASDVLINTFKEIANEAKGIASADWSGTLSVFDSADSKMKSLSELVNALGKDYSLTADEARKFASVFPELLSKGQITASGLIQFNRDVINDFVSGTQTEVQADIDSQIAQLENRKSVLVAKKATAQAALDLIAAQASGEIDAENQKNTKIAAAKDNLTQHLIDLGVSESEANEAVTEAMAGNFQEYDRVVSEVSANVNTNLTDSSTEASTNVISQAKAMVKALFNVGDQANNTAEAVKSIGSGVIVKAVENGVAGIGNVIKKFVGDPIKGAFKSVERKIVDVEKYKPQDKTVKLKLDISNYDKAIGEIESQKALLQSSASKGLGDYGSSGKGGGGSSKKASEDKIKEYEHIQAALDDAARKQQMISNLVNDENLSYGKRVSLMQSLLDADDISIKVNKEALENYNDQWAEIITKVQTLFGLNEGNTLIAKIMSGDTSLNGWVDSIDQGTVAGKKQVEVMDKAVSIYGKLTTQEDNYAKMVQQKTEDIKKNFEIRLNMLKAQLDEVNSAMKRAQTKMDIRKDGNQIISESEYHNMINLAGEQIGLYEKQIRVLKRQLKIFKPYSAEWYNIKSQIDSCNDSILDCEKSQQEWNKAILEIPIEHLKKQNEELDKQISKLEKQKDTYDKALAGVTDILDEQKEALEDQKKASDEYYDGLIKNLETEKTGIQDQIDALKKKNDEQNRVAETEKKLAALEKAKTQKTDKKLVNGEWTWDVDYDAINSSQKDYDEQLNDNHINDLEDQKSDIQDKIDGLNKDKQDASDKIQGQMDALEEYRKKWEDISSAWEKAQNQQAATSYFQMTLEQLKNELLGQNLNLIDKMNSSYQDVQSNMDALNTTKEKNEELIDTFQSYIDKWQQGVLSIGQAKQLIQDTVADNGIEIEALNQRMSSVGEYRGSWNDTRDSISDDLDDVNDAEQESTEKEQEMWQQKLAQFSAFRTDFGTGVQGMVQEFSAQMDTMLNKFAESATQMEEYARRISQAAREAREAEREKDSDKNSGSSNKHSGGSSHSSGSSKPTGPASDPDLKKHHRGILAGRVDSGSSNSRSITDTLRALISDPPKDNEIIKVLEKDEWVLTDQQVRSLIDNVNISRQIPLFNNQTPSVMGTVDHEPSQEIVFNGGINITEAQNVTDIAGGIMKGGLKQALQREIYKR